MKVLSDSKSQFSFGESLLSPADVARLAKAAGYDAAALCDTMTISGMPGFTAACEEHGLKPIIGVRLRIVPSLERVKKQPTVYPKLFILTDEGFRIVTRLLTRANDEDHFYYKPRLTFADLLDALQHARGHVAYATGTLYSAIRDAQHVATLEKINACLSASHTFTEIVPADSAVWDRQAIAAHRAAEALGLLTLLGRPVIYEDLGSESVLDFMGSIVNNFRSGDEFSSLIKDYVALEPVALIRQAMTQLARLQSRFGVATDKTWISRSLEGWKTLADAVSFHWKKQPISLPRMAPDENVELKRLAIEGFKDRVGREVFGYKPDTAAVAAQYVPRLKFELDVLERMGFAGYFLLTREIVVWAKSHGILVGPGRGSVGGSLVAYALGITDVDPIRFGLLFERFINPDRLDLPDADLDFMSTRRQDVIGHIADTYGHDCVAGVSNYTELASKSAIADVSRLLDLPLHERGVSKLIPTEQGKPVPLERAVTEVAAVQGFAARNPKAWKLAQGIEGKMRNCGTHASAVVAAGEPLVNRAVLENRKGSLVVNWDGAIVENMGLVKLDILGLSTLDHLEATCRKVQKRHGVKVDLSATPLDDLDVLAAFGRGETIGVFQFESSGMRRLLADLAKAGTLTFGDLAAANALYRPGPMESGLLDDFVAIRQGMMSEHYEHPSMRAALEETYSVIVFQEQVMRIARDLCGFSLTEADHLRKAIGKKKPEEMKKNAAKFVAGAVAAGLDPAKAQELWDKIEVFAGYAFNKSHAAAYSIIATQCMWLKVRYPVEFYAGAMTALGSEKMPGLLNEAKKKGIRVLPPDINISTDEFEPLREDIIIAPFNVMMGLSQKGASAIMKARATPFASLEDLKARTERRVVNASVLDKLDRIGAFARITPGQRLASDPSRRPDQLDLVPSIMLGGAIVSRDLHIDKLTITALKEAIAEVRALPETERMIVCSPKVGKTSKFMAIFDGPGWSEEQGKQFTVGKSFDYCAEILDEAGLDIDDGYWTGLSKAPKPAGEKLYPPALLRIFTPLLEREIELMNPQVVVVLGTNVMRMFAPKLKGGLAENAGKILYDKAGDRNIVLGINPGMIAFDSAKRELLLDAFKKVREMVY